MSEKMRSEFEAWYESTYGISLEREFRSNHFIGYVNDKANHRWAAWQASRAALCVELPANPNEEFSDRASAVESCRAALTAPAPGECVAVPRDVLADLVSLDREKRISAERHLYALLAQQEQQP